MRTTLVALVVLVCAAHSKLINQRVDTTVDLGSQFVALTVSAEVANDKAAEPAAKYLFSLTPAAAAHLAFITASSVVAPPASDDAAATAAAAAAAAPVVTPLTVSRAAGEIQGAAQGSVHYEVVLDKPLAGTPVNITVSAVFTHSLVPHPASLKQHEHQRLVYKGDLALYSAYPTTRQITTVLLPLPGRIESKTEREPVAVSQQNITYGPFENIAPFTIDELAVHFWSNSPLLTITRMEREIEVSHWGNLAIEEHVWIQDDGAELKGPFSRFEYQRTPSSTPSIVAQFEQLLPPGASDIYYRDDVGNISTSEVLPYDDQETGVSGVRLVLTPRFPLFGGWKTAHYIGYNLPLGKYLSRSSISSLRLAAPFAVNFSNAVIDHLVVRVILPEGSSDIQFSAPFPVSQSMDVRKSYLDAFGRPVLVLEAHNIITNHNKDLIVTYSFNPLALFVEPVMLIAGFAALFAAVIVYLRISQFMSIGSTENQSPEDQFAALLKQLTAMVENLNAAHALLDNTATRAVAKERLQTGFKQLEQIRDAISAVNSLISSRLDTLVRKEKARQEIHARLIVQFDAKDVQRMKDIQEDMDAALVDIISH
jgi:oligosaccharyltransferase complex subunit alpha (ribophorin I)